MTIGESRENRSARKVDYSCRGRRTPFNLGEWANGLDAFAFDQYALVLDYPSGPHINKPTGFDENDRRGRPRLSRSHSEDRKTKHNDSEQYPFHLFLQRLRSPVKIPFV
jgi:hypothetical protein